MDSGEGVTQEFNGSVGQVAGGNIYNYYGDNKVIPAIKPELRRAVGELLAVCDPCNQRKLIEKISLKTFDTTDFKSLDVEQIYWLTNVAQDIASSINKSANDQKSSIAHKENQFHKEYGILASSPARDALLVLMEQNLTVKQIASAWNNRMLDFENNGQFVTSDKGRRFEKFMGRATTLFGFMMAIPAFAVIAPTDLKVIDISSGQASVLFTLFLIIAAFFVISGTNMLAPHRNLYHVSKHIPKVNEILKKTES